MVQLLRKRWRRVPAVIRFAAVAFGSPLLVVFLCISMKPVAEASLIIFLASVTLAAWYGGLWPGVVSAVESALLTAYFLMPPEKSFRVEQEPDLIRLGAFLFVAFLVSTLNAKRKSAEDRLRRAQKRLEQTLEAEAELARRDFLTGVANRRAFYERAEMEAARATLESGPITVAYLDIDGFKSVNDWGGHEAGDQLLVLMARTLVGHVRKTDLVGRLGGDEFAVLFPGTGGEDAKRILAKLHSELSAALENAPGKVSCSIGGATSLNGAEGADELIRKADEAMYRAKKAGKNCVMVS